MLNAAKGNAEPRKTSKKPFSAISFNDFEILSVVGRGAFGKVFTVRLKGMETDGGEEKIYAMKAIRKSIATNEKKVRCIVFILVCLLIINCVFLGNELFYMIDIISRRWAS